ncbi:uncharacterized protein F4812DRAFT_460861 [Daldinia caldariorum]|uniref:uncharacterized protein n=1 Tax=Daldinia caldariorum TaxID=326644 RepID=UPI0020088AB7|nr:uncharacterized protein F4812DRAFT_460861 [Daldinia caldariorum]KAI1466592.1 hypothetical protein F4812DRAFT_460861 [Daldinia caldariorum]
MDGNPPSSHYRNPYTPILPSDVTGLTSFTALSLLDCLSPNHPLISVLRAAQTGNDQLTEFFLFSSLADADQPPIPGEVTTSSAPILAAIGRENIKVIEVLLKQESFDPTRRLLWELFQEFPERKPTAKSYDEFLQRKLYRRIYRVLEKKVDDALKGQLEGIIRDVQTQLYEEVQTTFRTGEKQGLDGNDENATRMPISGIDLILLLQDACPLNSFSPPWSALSLEHLMDISNISFELLSSPADTVKEHNFSMVVSPLYTVKATHDFTSNYAEDLPFRVGQIIIVTNE